MKVQLLVAATTLPVLTDSQLFKDRARARILVSDGLKDSFHALADLTADDPLWKSSKTAKRLASKTKTNLRNEPDVGILDRSLQQYNNSGFNTTGLDACVMIASTLSTNGQGSCDCSHWQLLTGTFSCADSTPGTPYCSTVGGTQVCASLTLNVASDTNGGFNMSYCYNVTSPVVHEYCTTFETSLNALLSGDVSSGSSLCSISADGVDCITCQIDPFCNNGNPGPGVFDCTNTVAGSAGSMCAGSSPFPIFQAPADNTTLLPDDVLHDDGLTDDGTGTGGGAGTGTGTGGGTGTGTNGGASAGATGSSSAWKRGMLGSMTAGLVIGVSLI